MIDDPGVGPEGGEWESASATLLAGRFVSLWQEIAPRMADLPIYNPRLQVQSTEFRPHENWHIGIVTTPWFMNVIALPQDPTTLPQAGETVTIALPVGPLPAIVTRLEGVAPFAAASLFSPMDEFDDPDVTRRVAEAALVCLFEPEQPPPAPEPPRSSRVDRRSLLFGRRTPEAQP